MATGREALKANLSRFPAAATNRLPAARPCERPIPPEKRPSRRAGPPTAEDVRALLPFRLAADRDEMLDLYDRSLGVLKAERTKATEFLANVSKTNGFLDSVAVPDSSGPMLNKAKAWGLSAQRDRRLVALADILADDLRTRAEALVKDFADALESLVKKEQAGRVQWYSEDTCTYTFSTYRVTDEQKTTVRHVESQGINATVHRTETDFERTHRRTQHEHDLLDARCTAVDDPSVTLPARVSRLIELMPKFVRKVAYLVVGTQRGERRIEREVKMEVRTAVQERVVYDPVDPCLAIGGVVLTAWTTAEVAEEIWQKYRQTAEEEKRLKAKEDFGNAVGMISLLFLLTGYIWICCLFFRALTLR